MSTIYHHNFDIHLSASALSPETIKRLEAIGMRKDDLRNNRNSNEPHYHASAPKTRKPNQKLWNKIKSILIDDQSFNGALEFEVNSIFWREYFETCWNVTPETAIPFKLDRCKPGEHKACDVHIRISPFVTKKEACDELDKYNMIYFQRHAQGIWCPIYTLTFEEIEIAEAVSERLVQAFKRIPNLAGRLKLEKIYDYWVHPDDAHQLPIVRTKDAETWLTEMG